MRTTQRPKLKERIKGFLGSDRPSYRRRHGQEPAKVMPKPGARSSRAERGAEEREARATGEEYISDSPNRGQS